MIRARMIADGVVRFSVSFNAVPWFNQATKDDLKSLDAEGWTWNRRDSAAVVHAVAMHDDRLAAVLAALVKSNRNIPFTCIADEAHARAWMRRYRPRVVRDENEPDKVRLPLKRYLSGW